MVHNNTVAAAALSEFSIDLAGPIEVSPFSQKLQKLMQSDFCSVYRKTTIDFS